MPVFLDSSIAILARDDHVEARHRLVDLGETLALSTLVLAELERGVARDRALAKQRRVRLDLLLSAVIVVEFDRLAAQRYGALIAVLVLIDAM
jgi:predicted nucleic acid-binding protein